MRNIKKVVILLIIVGLISGVWVVAGKLVEFGGVDGRLTGEEETSYEKHNNSKDESYEREEIEIVDGETVMNQTGTNIDKSAQCVYDFFEETLPGLGFDTMEYEVKELEEGSYCVEVGDWYVFVMNESNISYPYKFTKIVDFTEEEKSLLLEMYEGSRFIKEGDLYVWEAD